MDRILPRHHLNIDIVSVYCLELNAGRIGPTLNLAKILPLPHFVSFLSILGNN